MWSLLRIPHAMILAGAFSCAAGACPNTVDPLPVSEVAERVDVDEAVAYGQQQGLRHVEVTLEAQEERRVHPTALREPAYTTACAPGDVVELDGSRDLAELARLRGCQVRVVSRGESEGFVTVKDGVLDKTSNTFEIHHLRVFAPAPGWGGGLWLVSPDVVADEAAEKAFPERGSWTGALTRLGDLRANAMGAERMVGELQKKLRSEAGGTLPDHTGMVLTDRGGAAPSYRFAYVPVAGSDDALFVRVRPDETVADHLPVDGILERSERGLARDLGEALGRELPERVGLLTPGGLQAYPRPDANPPAFRMAFGAVLIAVGAVWALGTRERKRPAHTPRPSRPAPARPPGAPRPPRPPGRR